MAPIQVDLRTKNNRKAMERKYLLLPLLCLMASCISPEEMKQDPLPGEDRYDSVVMVMPQSGYEDSEPHTRNVAIIGSQVDFVWSVSDSVGIFPDAGSQIYFSMASGAGQVSAAFDGGGWALKKSSEYFSYFPFTPDFYINKEALPLTYLGQKQIGNAQENRADIGNYGYMVAKGVADEETGSLYFSYERLGDLFRVKIPVLPGTYKSLTVRTDDDVLVQKGTYNAVDLGLEVDNPVYADSLTLELEDVTFAQSGTLVAFVMMAPFNYLNRQLTFELTDSEGNVAVSSVRGKNFERGMTYGNAPHVSVSPALNTVKGEASTFNFNIAASGTHAYTVTADVPWLTLGSSPASGNASVAVSVAENDTDKSRTGRITVSETVSGVLLKNVITITQEAGQVIGGGSGSGGFEDDDDEQGDGGFSFIYEDEEITEGETYTFGDEQSEYEF